MKPREFWIYPEVQDSCLVEVLSFDPVPVQECVKPYVHVIEKSAYDAIKAEHDKLWDTPGNKRLYKALNHIEQLTVESMKLRDAYADAYENDSYACPGEPLEAFDKFMISIGEE